MFGSYFFFFKQKTAYEMRISDWSSDVCSSDLCRADGPSGDSHRRPCPRCRHLCRSRPRRSGDVRAVDPLAAHARHGRCADRPLSGGRHRLDLTVPADRRHIPPELRQRSEEHTSELQSLMRSSYAVFCLKKKKEIKSLQDNTHTQFSIQK